MKSETRVDLIPAPPVDEPTIGREEMCKRLGISENTLKARIKSGKMIPPFFTGDRKQRWFWSEVRALLVRSREPMPVSNGFSKNGKRMGRPPKAGWPEEQATNAAAMEATAD